MLFNFNTFNHCPQGKIIVEDITQIMGQQLIALGHGVTWSEKLPFKPEGYNVVLESFADDPHTIESIAEAHAAGARFLYVATEEPTLTGFNHGLEPAMIERQNAFGPAAKYCAGILHLIPGEASTAWYSQYAPAAHAELGYAWGCVNLTADVKPDRMFGFYGKMTWRREQMLAQLEKAAGEKVLRIDSLDVPRALRDAMMRRARVIIQIRANDEWGMVSSTRCATALCFGRPIVGEAHPFEQPWSEVIHFAKPGEFYADAMDAADNWERLHSEQLLRFKDKLTPERCIGEPLKKIGIIQ